MGDAHFLTYALDPVMKETNVSEHGAMYCITGHGVYFTAQAGTSYKVFNDVGACALTKRQQFSESL